MNNKLVKLSIILLAGLLASTALFGCSNTTPSNPTNTADTVVDVTPTPNAENQDEVIVTDPVVTPTPTPEPVVEPTPTPSLEPEKDENGFTELQRNSFSMLYHLAITAEEIRISKNNRLMLDDIYTSLLNDINPSAIDEITQDHLKNLRDIINSYISINIKRDRLQYIYNQEKAAAIRSAVPNPLAVLSVTNSLDWKKLVIGVVYTAVDSYTNYKNASDSADQEFLMSGWELEDEERSAIQKNRDRAFDYMVDIVNEYALDGKLTLNEKAITTFAEICEIDSMQEKIRRLESKYDTYKLLGNYWLELASCYYETGEFQKCLDCIEEYNNISANIYRKDYNLVNILPKAIVAAQQIYKGEQYISVLDTFADTIIENTETEEWTVRYFAAQVYLDLYARTNNEDYLEAAYNIAYDNVTVLLDEQRKINTTYLADVQEQIAEEPDYKYMTEKEEKEAKAEYEAEKKRVNAYNKELKETRKTELVSLYEPLTLNCELLFSLAKEKNIGYKEKTEIEAILQTDKNGVFLSKPVNDYYSFKTLDPVYNVEFNQDRVSLSADLLTAKSIITVTVYDSGKKTVFDDFTIDKVERKGDSIDTFNVTASSESIKKYGWTENSKVTVEILVDGGNSKLIFEYKVIEFKDNWIKDKVVFSRI